MKKAMAMMAAFAVCGSAMAASLNVSVTSGGSSSVNVTAGSIVNYEVRGTLSDTSNEGLALFGFDLTFSGGALNQAGSPGGSIDNFVSPAGINNPAGFGGTIIGGALIQVGGGQNTINNTVDNAPFPIGSVITGIGHSEVILAVGSIDTTGLADGDYTLSLSNLFANVIKEGETGEVFWATEAAQAGSIGNLMISISTGGEIQIVGSSPANNSIDPKQPSAPDGSNAAGINSIVLTFDGDASGVTSGDLAVSVDPAGTAPGVASVSAAGNDLTVTLDSFAPLGHWTTITHVASGTSIRVGALPADVNNDKVAGVSDVLALVDSLNGVNVLPLSQTDIDRSGLAGAPDILRTIDLLNGAGTYDVWNLASLPN